MNKQQITISLQEFYRLIENNEHHSLSTVLLWITERVFSENIRAIEIDSLPVIPLDTDFSVLESSSWGSFEELPESGYHLHKVKVVQTLSMALGDETYLPHLLGATQVFQYSKLLETIFNNPTSEWVVVEYDKLKLVYIIALINGSIYIELVSQMCSWGVIAVHYSDRAPVIPAKLKALAYLLTNSIDIEESVKRNTTVYAKGTTEAINKLSASYMRARQGDL